MPARTENDERLEVLTHLFHRAEVARPPRRVYGFCELGRVVQLKLARREVHDKATGKSKITAGEISCPPEVYYACVEGDAHWQRLPAHRSFAELSEARAERVKITNFKAAARRAARGH